MKLFLDDDRIPIDCIPYMYDRIGVANAVYRADDWYVVKSYPAFVKAIKKYKGQITHISFDHDLVDKHYEPNMRVGIINYDSEEFVENSHKTGYHAAKHLKQVYEEHQLELPVILVHTMNPLGWGNIMNIFKATNARIVG